MRRIYSLTLFFHLSIAVGSAPAAVRLNEVNISSTGTEDCVELHGAPGESLNGLSYVVLSSMRGNHGVITHAVNLTEHSLSDKSPFYVVGDRPAFSRYPGLLVDLAFGAADQTHLLVTEFRGRVGLDLDERNAGVLDIERVPWSEIVDSVAFSLGYGRTYGPVVVPRYKVGLAAFRQPDGTGIWRVGEKTPGAANPAWSPPTAVPFGSASTLDERDAGANDLDAADLDGDGDLDLLDTSAETNSVWWWRNDTGPAGGGWDGLAIADQFPGAQAVRAADLDGDGDLDVVGLARDTGTLTWWENALGDGSEWAWHNIAEGLAPPTGLSTADLDGDGDADLAVASAEEGTITWWSNRRGDPTEWHRRNVVQDFPGASALRAADIDRDGDLDLVAASETYNQIAWFANVVGTGEAWEQRSIDQDAPGVRDAATADLDGDGDPDVVAATQGQIGIWAWLNTAGDGSSWQRIEVDDETPDAISVCCADFDADGDLDIAGAVPNSVFWCENLEGDGANWALRSGANSFAGGRKLRAADLDGDGLQDLLLAAGSPHSAVWFRNLSIHRSAWFESKDTISADLPGATRGALGDLGPDGDLDAASVGEAPAVHENNGNAPLTFATRYLEASGAGGWADVRIADLDGDGDGDLATARAGSPDSGEPSEILFWRNSGGENPSFSPVPIYPGVDPLGNALGEPKSLGTSDLDGDGDLDVVAAFADPDVGSRIVAFENEGGEAAAWANLHTLYEGSYPGWDLRRLACGDLNRDGFDDIAMIFYDSDHVAWFRNQTGFEFSPTTISRGDADGPTDLCLADLDDDGRLDIVTVSAGDGEVSWFRNIGSGVAASFSPMPIAGQIGTPTAVGAMDMDGDGDQDVIVARNVVGANAGGAIWFENRYGDAGSWIAHYLSADLSGIGWLAPGDLDGDGDSDIVALSRAEGALCWYENTGGQFALLAADLAPSTIREDAQQAVLRVEAHHRGRAGDREAELATLRVRIETPVRGGVRPLSSEEASALLSRLMLYRYVGSWPAGSWVGYRDAFVAQVEEFNLDDGVLEINLPDGHDYSQFAHDAPAAFFIVAELTSTAASQTPSEFRFTLLSDPKAFAGKTSTAEDRTKDVALRIERRPNFSSKVVTARRAGDVRFVSSGGPTAGNGTSWAMAFRRISDALAVANERDEIWVARGMYAESIVLKSHVALYGGFFGDETDVSQRDPVGQPTVIAVNFVNNNTPAHHAVTMAGVHYALLDGFVLTGGEADGDTPDNRGGGLYGQDLDATNVVANCKFARNSATQGGGVALVNCSLTLDHCTISGNEAEYGGGLYLSGSQPTLSNCSMGGNAASSRGGALYAISLSDAQVTNCVVEGNSADVSAGGLYASSSSALNVKNTVFLNNTKYALYETIENSEGGATHCLFYGNPDGDYYRGSSYFFLPRLRTEFYPKYTFPTLTPLTLSIIHNNVEEDPLFVMDGEEAITGSWTSVLTYGGDTVVLTVLTDASAHFASNALVGRMLNPNVEQNKQILILGNDETAVALYGRVGSFVAVGDTYRVVDYHIAQGSPCVNKGDNNAPRLPATDLDYEDRIQFGQVDIGADEMSDAPRLERAIYNDSNNDGLVEADEKLTLVMTAGVVVASGSLSPASFYLPVAGDSLGEAGFAVESNPQNTREIVVTLGAGASLNVAGDFSRYNQEPGAPSGIDLAAALAPGAIESLAGVGATDRGEPGVDDAGVDVFFTCVARSLDIGSGGGLLRVVTTPNAIYRYHALRVPVGALAIGGTFTLRPSARSLGVSNAVEIEFSGGAEFAEPVTLTLEYSDSDVDRESGQLEASMRIHQLVEYPPGTFTWVPVPGERTVDLTSKTVSVDLLSLDPLGTIEPGLRGRAGSGKTEFAVLPGSTIEPVMVYVKPDVGGSPPAARAVVRLRSPRGIPVQAGSVGDYTLHAIEIPDYAVAEESDPQAIAIQILQPTFLQRVSFDSQSFPAQSSAFFAVTTRKAGKLTAFSEPVNLRVQFMDGTKNAYNDVIDFSEGTGSIGQMRIVTDQLDGTPVDFAFVEGVDQAIDADAGTIEGFAIRNLTSESGVSVWGAVVDRSVSTEASSAHWELYE